MKVILILHRGWVVIGEEVSRSDTLVRLENTSIIRRFGTTKGLGQIALTGPTENTLLDPVGTFDVHPMNIIGRIHCVV